MVLGSCVATTAAPPQETAGARLESRRIVYACEDGERLVGGFQNGAATLVDAQARSFQLARQVTGSGFLYEGEGQSLRGKGEEMTWTVPGVAPRACSAAVSPLAGTRWQLVQFQSSHDAVGTLKPEDPTRYVMDLIVGGRLAMQLDCNRAVGRWEARPTSATGGSISFGASAMTLAACLSGSMDTRIARDLGSVRTYTLDGDRLNLALEADGGVYTWRQMAQ
jgi:heat shock protein HslJ